MNLLDSWAHLSLCGDAQNPSGHIREQHYLTGHALGKRWSLTGGPSLDVPSNRGDSETAK